MIGDNYITQIYKKWTHPALDLKSVNEKWEDLDIELPEDAKLIRITWELKWGFSYIFETLETDFIIQFTHVSQNYMTQGKIYKKGDRLGYATTTAYMDGRDRRSKKPRSKKHLHFSTFTIKNGDKHKAFDPVKYLKLVGQKCEKA